jgi:NhaP-type Na+/H+ and K+/H+ antiporter
VLATIGVAITALIMGLFISLADGVPFLGALLAGAAAAPTDAAAVAVLLRRAGAALPDRLLALLEVESGLNDPMSVFLCFLVIHLIAEPGSLGPGDSALLFVKEMAGGALLGLGGGWALAQSLKRLRLEASAHTGAGAERRTCGFRFLAASRDQRVSRDIFGSRGGRRDPASLETGCRAFL